MILGNVLRRASLLVILTLASSPQIIAEVDVPELLLLASHLKPEECAKIVSFDSHPPLTKGQIKKSTGEQDCFQRLVKWICQWRTVTKNTYTILKDRLEFIGRKDLIPCLIDASVIQSTMSPKMIREVQSFNEAKDYDEMTTTLQADANTKPKSENDTKHLVSNNNTIDKIDGHTSIRLRLKSAGIILIVTILLTCCCTLFIRNKCAKLFNKLRGKKKKSKFVIMASEDGREAPRVLSRKKSYKKRKRAPSYDMVQQAAQNSVALTPREPEEPSPTGCYRCYKKKRKKSGKQPRR